MLICFLLITLLINQLIVSVLQTSHGSNIQMLLYPCEWGNWCIDKSQIYHLLITWIYESIKNTNNLLVISLCRNRSSIKMTSQTNRCIPPPCWLEIPFSNTLFLLDFKDKTRCHQCYVPRHAEDREEIWLLCTIFILKNNRLQRLGC